MSNAKILYFSGVVLLSYMHFLDKLFIYPLKPQDAIFKKHDAVDIRHLAPVPGQDDEHKTINTNRIENYPIPCRTVGT